MRPAKKTLSSILLILLASLAWTNMTFAQGLPRVAAQPQSAPDAQQHSSALDPMKFLAELVADPQIARYSYLFEIDGKNLITRVLRRLDVKTGRDLADHVARFYLRDNARRLVDLYNGKDRAQIIAMFRKRPDIVALIGKHRHVFDVQSLGDVVARVEVLDACIKRDKLWAGAHKMGCAEYFQKPVDVPTARNELYAAELALRIGMNYGGPPILHQIGGILESIHSEVGQSI